MKLNGAGLSKVPDWREGISGPGICKAPPVSLLCLDRADSVRANTQ